MPAFYKDAYKGGMAGNSKKVGLGRVLVLELQSISPLRACTPLAHNEESLMKGRRDPS